MTTRNPRRLALIVLCTALPALGSAEDPRHAPPSPAARVDGTAHAELTCPARVGVPDQAALDAFVRAVREALASPEPGRIASLVRLPLTVNSRDRRFGQPRSRRIVAADELRRHAAELFGRGLRKRILKAPAGDLICRDGALGFTGGLLWARPGDGGRLLIEVVNDDELQWPDMTDAELLRCRTTDHLIVIDRPQERVRLRGWAIGESTAGRPKLVLLEGAESFEGSGAYPVWTFARGRGRVVVRPAGGCGAEAGPPRTLGCVSFLEEGTPWPNDRVPEQPCFD
jgi:hypothetical protein